MNLTLDDVLKISMGIMALLGAWLLLILCKER